MSENCQHSHRRFAIPTYNAEIAVTAVLRAAWGLIIYADNSGCACFEDWGSILIVLLPNTCGNIYTGAFFDYLTNNYNLTSKSMYSLQNQLPIHFPPIYTIPSQLYNHCITEKAHPTDIFITFIQLYSNSRKRWGGVFKNLFLWRPAAFGSAAASFNIILPLHLLYKFSKPGYQVEII